MLTPEPAAPRCADSDHARHLRERLQAAIDARNLPRSATSCYGERVDMTRYVHWLLTALDSPTLTAITTLLEAPVRDSRRD